MVRRVGAILAMLVVILSASALLAQTAPEVAKPDDGKLTVLIKPIEAFKGLQDLDKLLDFATDFVQLDPRYTVTHKADAAASVVIQMSFSRSKKGMTLTIKSDTVGIRQGDYSTDLSARPTLAKIEAEISRGLRLTMDYKPAVRKMLVKIMGTAAEGDAYGESVEDAIVEALKAEFERLDNDESTYPVADSDVPALLKGSKTPLDKIRAAGVNLLVVGTVTVPKTKNIGGASENLYRGKAEVLVKVWDLTRQHLMTQINLELTGEGAFTELVYKLFEGAGEKTADMLLNDMGYPKPEAAKQEDAPEEN
jgi:hypothetical protein